MGALVYVETNFLMSVAMGREAHGDDLLACVSPSVRLAIPSGCYMEAFSAFEDEEKRRNWFTGELEKQIGQLKRDTTSAHAGTLEKHLDHARHVNKDLLDDIRARLFRFVERACDVLELIPATPGILRAAVGPNLIPDPTDHPILHSILEHAARNPAETKALLTDNIKDFSLPAVAAALNSVGIAKSFRTATSVLGWLGSLPP